ncbi:hypothetical protein FGG08_003072 [Glutinoglossum americanum]|uniref:Cytochrome P450 n=1 Tax=Glutinoglossum americanum TaxID=1670608 RepID=A0A9P8L124_9PEZI|nr:hypothetical protein FGG08_003072 [Glutinoglossum americanum]
MLLERITTDFLPIWALPVLLLLIYSLFLVVYRLYFHPLAQFPGPRLAAATLWYEFYHDVIRRGKYIWEIKDMHTKYGPIVRIGPHELHIDDPDFFDTFYNQKTDKWEWFTRQFGNGESTQSTPRHDLHRVRRAALAPFFTRTKVLQLESIIKDKIEMLSARLSASRKSNNDRKHAGQEPEPLCLGLAYHCLTTEVVTQYSWSRSYECLDHPDFRAEWFTMLRGLAEVGHIGRQFGWFLPLIDNLPVWLAGLVSANAKDSAEFRRHLSEQVTEIKMTPREQFSGKSHPTIFHELHNSNLPEYERSTHRLMQEGLLVLFAGFETTANAMAVTTYHLLRNPEKLARVRAELEGVMKGRDLDARGWVDLEKLEYFVGSFLTRSLAYQTLADF